MAKSVTKDMTSGSPIGLILKFSLPMLIGNVFQQIYFFVDSVVVGKFVGENALAAVGATGPLMFLIIGLSFGLSIGISVVIAQYFGAKELDNVKKAFASATYLVIGVSIIMGIVGFLSARSLLELLGTPPEIIGQSELFMKISFAGVLGVTCYNGMAAVLRALGDSITPLIFLAVACILNVVLDIVFVYFWHWDVPGVAIATTISQNVAAIGCTIYALIKVKLLRIPIREFKPDIEILKKCIKLGVPIALQNAFVSISMIALQFVINSYGPLVVAANTAYSRIEALVLMPGMSVGAALASYTGQNVGAGNLDRAKKGYHAAARIIIIFSLVMLPVIYFGGESVMRLFSDKDSTEVVHVGANAMRITCFFYSAVGMIFITRNFLSGAGDIHIPMIMGLTEVVCRIAFAIILPIYFGVYGIWWATSINWVITAIVGILREASGKWKDKALIRSQVSKI